MKFDIPLSSSGTQLFNNLILQYYGCIEGKFPTGRPNDSEVIEADLFKEIVHNIHTNGGEFNYLLNGNIGDLDISIFRAYFSWIINEVQPNIITFSDPQVYHFLKSKFNFINFEISAIAGIESEKGLYQFIKMNQIEIQDIRKIVLHHDYIIKNHSSSQIIDFLKKQGISPRVLVTESCYYRCPYRNAHYKSLLSSFKQSNKAFTDYFQIGCILNRLKHPESLLDLSGFLLPEQVLAFSKNTGIDSFKISGRSKSSNWINNTTKAYLNRKSPENLYDIIVFTAPYLSDFYMDVNDLFYLNSRAYLDMYLEMSGINDNKTRQVFFKQKSASFYIDGHLKINDPDSIYDIKNGELKLLQKGKYLKHLEKESSKYSLGLKFEI
jgi:collagenase-like PrtC family protease